jgi:hypothetical protein
MEDVNPFALDPAQLEMIRGFFWFFIAAIAVYIASILAIKIMSGLFSGDSFSGNNQDRVSYRPN